MIYVSSADAPDGWSLPREGPGRPGTTRRYRHWARRGASSLSPLLSVATPVGRFKSRPPHQDQSRSQARQGILITTVKVCSASHSPLAHPFLAVMNIPAPLCVRNLGRAGRPCSRATGYGGVRAGGQPCQVRETGHGSSKTWPCWTARAPLPEEKERSPCHVDSGGGIQRGAMWTAS